MPLPDPDRSWAVLIGTSSYTNTDDDLEDIPAVRNNLRELRNALTNPRLGGLRSDHCDSVLNSGRERAVLEALHKACSRATDAIVVYYAGHGILDGTMNLHLALTNSARSPIVSDTLPFAKVREVLTTTRASTRVLILDCCYSESAVTPMGATRDISTRVAVEGAYTLMSSGRTIESLWIRGRRFTAFTEHLLRLVSTGIPGGPDVLDMRAIYEHLLVSLPAAGMPEPKQHTSNTAQAIALVHNVAWLPPAPPTVATPIPTPTRALVPALDLDNEAPAWSHRGDLAARVRGKWDRYSGRILGAGAAAYCMAALVASVLLGKEFLGDAGLGLHALGLASFWMWLVAAGWHQSVIRKADADWPGVVVAHMGYILVAVAAGRLLSNSVWEAAWLGLVVVPVIVAPYCATRPLGRAASASLLGIAIAALPVMLVGSALALG